MTITAVGDDDYENEWRRRLVDDIHALGEDIESRKAQHREKYIEISLTVWEPVLGGTPYPGGSVKATMCTDCGVLVEDTNIHDRVCP